MNIKRNYKQNKATIHLLWFVGSFGLMVLGIERNNWLIWLGILSLWVSCYFMLFRGKEEKE